MNTRHIPIVLATMMAALTTACASEGPRAARPRGATEPDMVPALEDLFGEAGALRARLRRGELPAGVEHVVRGLEDIASGPREDPRASSALREAASLLAARYALGRDWRDLERADALLARAERIGTPDERCAATAAAGDLLASVGEPERARVRYLAYERGCHGGPSLAHVHAGLALLDSAVARAESESARSASRVQDEGPRIPAGLRRVVVDPGHGGSDPGARGPSGLAESAVTLDVARRLADRLSATTGIEVLLTRDADVFVPLEDRAERANAAGADLFVSVHCNSADNPESRGVSTYVLDTASDRVAQRVALRENGAATTDPLADPEIFRILADLRLVGQGSRSLEAATAIQRSLVSALAERFADVVDLGVHPARFHVLVGARMPAVLVELSFLSNAVEERRLASASYRDTLADAIARAIAGLRR